MVAAAFLFRSDRTAVVERNTAETQIRVEIDLDGTSKCDIHTGLSFFDHMLDQLTADVQKEAGKDLTE